jgi:hypothetical protein
MKAIAPRQWIVAWLAGGALFLVLGSAAAAAPPKAWSWRASGTLGRAPECSKAGVLASHDICGFKIPNAPRASGTVTGVVRVKNTGARVACYGVSLSTSFMAGLQSFCVKANSSGQFITKGPARHYDGTALSFFVTSGSKTEPIQALRGTSTSPFTITFSEPLH